MSLKNMKKTILLLLCSAFPVMVLAQAQVTPAKGDAAAGKGKAVAVCSGCHGVPGIRTAYPEVYNVPKLGGQNADYIVSALRSYRAWSLRFATPRWRPLAERLFASIAGVAAWTKRVRRPA